MMKTHDEEDDSRLVLARESGFGEVSICACGAVTLDLEGVQLRFSSQAFIELVKLVETSAKSAVLHAAALAPGSRRPMVQ